MVGRKILWQALKKFNNKHQNIHGHIPLPTICGHHNRTRHVDAQHKLIYTFVCKHAMVRIWEAINRLWTDQINTAASALPLFFFALIIVRWPRPALSPPYMVTVPEVHSYECGVLSNVPARNFDRLPCGGALLELASAIDGGCPPLTMATLHAGKLTSPPLGGVTAGTTLCDGDSLVRDGGEGGGVHAHSRQSRASGSTLYSRKWGDGLHCGQKSSQCFIDGSSVAVWQQWLTDGRLSRTATLCHARGGGLLHGVISFAHKRQHQGLVASSWWQGSDRDREHWLPVREDRHQPYC